MVCKICGSEFDNTEKSCPICGSPVEDSIGDDLDLDKELEELRGLSSVGESSENSDTLLAYDRDNSEDDLAVGVEKDLDLNVVDMNDTSSADNSVGSSVDNLENIPDSDDIDKELEELSGLSSVEDSDSDLLEESMRTEDSNSKSKSDSSDSDELMNIYDTEEDETSGTGKKKIKIKIPKLSLKLILKCIGGLVIVLLVVLLIVNLFNGNISTFGLIPKALK